jgi:hypothetical protein
MIRNTLPALFVVGLVCCMALAATQTVTLNNKENTKITGDVTKTADGGCEVKLIDGIVITYAKDMVKSVTTVASPQAEYQNRLTKIDPKKEAEGRLEIAKWAIGGNYMDIARKELTKVVALEPDNERAKLDLRDVQATLDEAAQAGKITKAETPPTTNVAGDETIKGATQDLVSDEDIYKIRYYELKKKDIEKKDPVALDFRNKVLDRFIKQMRGYKEFKDPNAETEFKKLSKIQQLQVIVDNIGDKDRDITDDIMVKTDPVFMKDFRVFVWPAIANNCAAVGCHGSKEGRGGLKLFKVEGRNDRADYANFLILSTWENKDGKMLLDRSDTEKSLLLQYGLPEKVAVDRHLKVLDHTLFQSAKVANYIKFEAWIKSLQGYTSPDYRTKYQPPVGRKIGGSDTTSKPASSSKPTTEEADPFNK